MGWLPQAVAGTLSAHAIVASPTQAVLLHVRTVSSPYRSVEFVFTRSDCNFPRDDERSSPAERFRNGEKLLRTRMEIFPLCKLAAPPAQRTA